MKITGVLFGLLALSVSSAMMCAGQGRIPVWIDTDPSVAQGGHEVDDGFALIQAFHSPELHVVGVSVVFGNAPLETAWPIGKHIVEEFGPPGLKPFKGAAGADQMGKETDASEAIEQALRDGPLTIVAIGPVTTVATVLKLHADLARQIVRIIVVAGRRPGQRFVANPSQPHAFRDLNFELDPAGFQVLLDSGVPLVMAPWEISSKVWIRQKDLELLKKGGPAARFLTPPAIDWLDWWRKNLGVDGFNPFDTLAIGYLTSSALFQCSESRAEIQTAPDDIDATAMAKAKPYLYVSPDLHTARSVTYCYNVLPAFKEDLLRRLLNESNR